jgi:hypothetical protein|tara:strand:- start:451 stop:777 length:327 start_codon:yes stop_codon:yes gene_type:complete
MWDKYHPGYFGKVGMRYFHKTQQKFFAPVMNLDKIWTLVSEQTRTKYANDPEGKAPVIDCVRAVSARLPMIVCAACPWRPTGFGTMWMPRTWCMASSGWWAVGALTAH